MNDRRKAESLSRYLDALLRGQDTSATAADAEVKALGELGKSMAEVEVKPRTAHRARVGRMLRERRPITRVGGPAMSRLILGIPLKWLFALLATLVGGAAVVGTGAMVVVLAVVQGDDVLPPVPEAPVIEVVLEDPVDSAITVTVPVTSPVVLTVTVPITPPVVPTDTLLITPTLVPTKPGMSGLAFHPAHLNAGGKCGEAYEARGSLKNHGPALATGVVIGYEVVSGAEWVDHIELTPSTWDELGTSKPARFTVSVHTNEGWPLAGKGTRIEVRLFVVGEEGVPGEEGTEAVFVVKNQCKPDKLAKPEKPEKPVKPEKPAKPERPVKPEKPDKPKKDR
jgi:hypothetical protein